MIQNLLKPFLYIFHFLKPFLSKLFTSYVLPLLGFLLLALYFYNGFIRQRLPKSVPIHLHELYFYLLLYIIGIYIYIIKQHFFPKVPNPHIITIIQFFSKPLILFDHFVKTNRFIYKYYIKLFFYISRTIISYSRWESLSFESLFYLSPRIILVSIFLFDVFILNRLEIFYYFIPLGLMPIIYRYLIYSVEFAYEQFLLYLELRYREIWICMYMGDFVRTQLDEDDEEYIDIKIAKYHDRRVTIKEYIETQYKIFKSEEEEYDNYEITPFSSRYNFEEYRKKYKLSPNVKLTEKDYDIMEKEFHRFIPALVDIYISMKYHKDFINYFNIPKIKIIIYLGYLIGWSYILYKSYPTLESLDITIKVLKIINKYQEIIEPFSGLFIFEL